MPVSLDPLNADAGLNCYGMNGYNLNQVFGDVGATLYLEWNGPIQPRNVGAPPPYVPGVMTDQFPWRCIIRGPVGANDLRVIGARFDSYALRSHLTPKFWGYLPFWFRRKLQRKRILRFLLWFRQRTRAVPCFIQVAA